MSVVFRILILLLVSLYYYTHSDGIVTISVDVHHRADEHFAIEFLTSHLITENAVETY